MELSTTPPNTLPWNAVLHPRYYKRWILAFLLFAIPIFFGEETRSVFFGSIADAYIQVSVFVAITLLFFHWIEMVFGLDAATLLERYKAFQIPISAFMGMLPGCGGAVIIMTQYTMGRLGFGSVVAVLTSTMGDAAFLLIAQEPRSAVIILSISLIVGIVFGYLIEWIHGYDFMRCERKDDLHSYNGFMTYGSLKYPWIFLLIPGIILGILVAFQMSDVIDSFFASIGIPYFMISVGALGALLSFVLWFMNPTAGTVDSNRLSCHSMHNVWDKVTADTSFITTWVIVAYLIFELFILWTGADLQSLFESARIFVPMIAILIGFLPGCGPQVIVTSMYLAGLIPFSAQLGNAISNDGDALFPAIAMSRKASIVATIYTAIPAVLVAYLWFFLFE